MVGKAEMHLGCSRQEWELPCSQKTIQAGLQNTQILAEPQINLFLKILIAHNVRKKV